MTAGLLDPSLEGGILERAKWAFRIMLVAERLVAAEEEADNAEAGWDALHILDSGTRCRLAQERVKAQRAALRAEVNR